MQPPEDLLGRLPEEAVRLVALGFLGDADEAAARLDDPEDAEALHDFRVAIRRLRSTLRAWAERLEGAVRKKDRRALRRLQDATGGGRDAEVALAWLASERPQLQASHLHGHDWLATHLGDRHAAAMEHARQGLRNEYQRIRARLADRLAVLTVERNLLAEEKPASFAEALAPKARHLAANVARLLRRVEDDEDRKRCHRARIAGKRLRYLLEPIRGQADGAPEVVERCKRLQDVLGDLNDAHVLRDELDAAVEAATSKRAQDPHEPSRDAHSSKLASKKSHGQHRPALLELRRRVQIRIEELFGDLRTEWLEGGVDSLLAEVETLAARLEGGPRIE